MKNLGALCSVELYLGKISWNQFTEWYWKSSFQGTFAKINLRVKLGIIAFTSECKIYPRRAAKHFCNFPWNQRISKFSMLLSRNSISNPHLPLSAPKSTCTKWIGIRLKLFFREVIHILMKSCVHLSSKVHSMNLEYEYWSFPVKISTSLYCHDFHEKFRQIRTRYFRTSL